MQALQSQVGPTCHLVFLFPWLLALLSDGRLMCGYMERSRGSGAILRLPLNGFHASLISLEGCQLHLGSPSGELRLQVAFAQFLCSHLPHKGVVMMQEEGRRTLKTNEISNAARSLE